ncbi:hypothetical protein L596_017619 [Steinernema carpocapsae]|uniref:Uncharacterized protein n=1 Tax=Steinernema carpocapsae TaxID=34508 RepID=A0A4U5N2G4_STECR|nr:hypothetical protein L596_017619 [Steinernema carpocapsae]
MKVIIHIQPHSKSNPKSDCAIWQRSVKAKKRILQVVERSRRDYSTQTTIGYDENGVMWLLVKFFVFIAL